ncbi:hypothetical protein EON65_27010 [archaeon]|nr:MAG: hypothetical protein EON65_27010 [archaeon]
MMTCAFEQAKGGMVACGGLDNLCTIYQLNQPQVSSHITYEIIYVYFPAYRPPTYSNHLFLTTPLFKQYPGSSLVPRAGSSRWLSVLLPLHQRELHPDFFR